MRNDWLDYPLSVFISGINSVVGSLLLGVLAVACGTGAAFIQEMHPESIAQVLREIPQALLGLTVGGGFLLVLSIIFPFCWPFLLGFFVGLFRLMRFDGHPFWMFWLMTACQFFIAVIEFWRTGDSMIGWKGFSFGLLILGGAFLISLGLFYALARRRRRLDQSAMLDCQPPSYIKTADTPPI
ncbi:MAG: hypothetical protein NT105_18790 [Verrucomicrobia bacterium]|nr:hypothetical protein [Verrucomicrobiota bacterium]